MGQIVNLIANLRRGLATRLAGITLGPGRRINNPPQVNNLPHRCKRRLCYHNGIEGFL
jgi:hypothetical protein